ncbi:MAG: hypothetical protein GY805_25130, partial [Chloroflexi bacterium]|nr:hypothetical protein [Chloroflexota bacterium]
WQERCLFIRSKNYTEAMLPKFQQRLDKAEAALRRLTPIPGKGKKQIGDKKTLKKKVKAVEKKYKIGGLFNIQRERQVKTRHIRAYNLTPADFNQLP